MKDKLSTLDEWLLNQVRKTKNLSTQRIINEMVFDLKQKHEEQQQQHIDDLTEQLRIARV